MPQSSTVWCASTSRSPLQRSVKSITACRANKVSIWSKNEMPVLTDDFPVPSMFKLAEICVSVVFRPILAFRAFGSARVATNVKAKTKGRAWLVSTYSLGRGRLIGPEVTESLVNEEEESALNRPSPSERRNSGTGVPARRTLLESLHVAATCFAPQSGHNRSAVLRSRA